MLKYSFMTVPSNNATPFHIIAFAAAAEIVGGDSCQLSLPPGATVGTLRQALLAHYPAFAELASFAIARNQQYATDAEVLEAADELAIIPPVSGG